MSAIHGPYRVSDFAGQLASGAMPVPTSCRPQRLQWTPSSSVGDAVGGVRSDLSGDNPRSEDAEAKGLTDTKIEPGGVP